MYGRGIVHFLEWSSFEVFFQENILLTGLFILSGFCAGCHVLSQKMIADQMDIIDSNLSIFAVSAILAFIPLVPGMTGGDLAGVRPDLGCIAGILIFGFITGIGFYLNARAILLVPFYMVPVIQSTMAIFAILWGVLFFHEKNQRLYRWRNRNVYYRIDWFAIKRKDTKKENAK